MRLAEGDGGVLCMEALYPKRGREWDPLLCLSSNGLKVSRRVFFWFPQAQGLIETAYRAQRRATPGKISMECYS